MRRHLTRFVVALAVLTLSFGIATLSSSADKLPRCSDVHCKKIDCPADVLCAAGSSVKTCAEVCGGH